MKNIVKSDLGSNFMDSNQELKGLRNQYLAALASSDSSLARYTVEQAQVQGIGILRIYLDILVSSQIDLGEMWHEGKINIAQEHLATTITLDIMNKLSIESTPRKPHGYRAIVFRKRLVGSPFGYKNIII